jgi:hypothetical protein
MDRWFELHVSNNHLTKTEQHVEKSMKVSYWQITSKDYLL